jgi:hypothetical protein
LCDRRCPAVAEGQKVGVTASTIAGSRRRAAAPRRGHDRDQPRTG